MHGVISGYPCGGAGEPCPGTYFRPNNNVTRGQTSKIVANTFYPGCQSQPTATPTHSPAATPTHVPTASVPTATPTTCAQLAMTIGPGNPGSSVVIRSGTGPNKITQSRNSAPDSSKNPGLWQPLAPISFILDDGSQDATIGLHNSTVSYPAIWLNRFTPSGSDYPITLNQISIQFPNSTAAGIDLTGRAIDLLVYLDTDGNNDPSNATRLAQIHTTVQVANSLSFSNYTVNVSVPWPRRHLYRVLGYLQRRRLYPHQFPAPEDQSTSQVRSWVIGMSNGSNPNYTNLAGNDLGGVIDWIRLAWQLGNPGKWHNFAMPDPTIVTKR